ncbi:unnamed protein product, partial [Didymodactylos carnosus]
MPDDYLLIDIFIIRSVVEVDNVILLSTRTDENIELKRNVIDHCLNNGTKYNFETLKKLVIEPAEILHWSSSIELVDRYAAYLESYDRNLSGSFLEMFEKDFICNCTKSGTFGKFCQYQFISYHNSFEETIVHQLKLKFEYFAGSQHIGNRTCYKTLTCDHGLLCLDWRELCDGKQQCIDGIDENNCELLEYNECQSDEYRCANGQCIDEKFFLDGQFDCMDRSDEQYKTLSIIFKYNFVYCGLKLDFNCEEVIMPRKDFSCGNGEIYPDRAVLKKKLINGEYCFSFRDKNFMCELDKYNPLWTMNNGQCVFYGKLEGNTTEDICLFLIKCGLMGGQGLECPCNGINCAPIIREQRCLNVDNLVEYPKGGIFAPYIRTFYVPEHIHSHRHPDYVMFTKSIKCSGFHVNAVNRSYYIPYDVDSFDRGNWRIFETLFCLNSTSENQNLSGPHYDLSCQNNFHHPTFQCSYGKHCISSYRVGDGNYDCLTAVDEQIVSEQYPILPVNCSVIQKHRFYCSINEPKCLLSTNLGDKLQHCTTNNRDEYSDEMKLLLSSVLCLNKNSIECDIVRKYIEQSSWTNTTSYYETNTSSPLVFSSTKTILFREYCDTFWDLKLGFDESSSLCKDWICPPNYYQCLNGQCIPLDWVCEGEWDCSDASDEEGLFTITKLSEHNSKIINLLNAQEACKKVHKIRPFSNICNFDEYPCLLANINEPHNMTNRPCINLTKIGDGIIDCYGGLDERNILSCTSQQMLGFNFACKSNISNLSSEFESCLLYTQQCMHRCLNGEDKALCFYLKNNSLLIRCDGTLHDTSETLYRDVHCFNQTCIPNARCNGNIECENGEDEYYCSSSTAPLFARYRSFGNKNIKTILKTISLPYYPKSSIETIIDNENKNNHYYDILFRGRKRLTSSRNGLNFVSSMLKYQNNNVNFSYFDPNNINDFILNAEEYLRFKSIEPWTCNRGVSVKKWLNNDEYDIECFCPPSYYGRFCQYFSDRLTIITHLDGVQQFYSNNVEILKNITIKVLITFLVNQTTIIDYNEIHFTPGLNDLDEKQRFYFVYPRPRLLSTEKPYSVRFEAFELNHNSSIRLLAVWIYKVDFNFLPSFRIAKILKFQLQQQQQQQNHICSTKSPCRNNGTCYRVMNMIDLSSYYCSCNSSFCGINCESIDNNYNCLSDHVCSSNALCRPSRLCLCPINRFGSTCHLKRQCDMFQNKNPCLNGGTCYVKYEPDALKQDYICVCLSNYFGDICQYTSVVLDIQYEISFFNTTILASVVQLLNFDNTTLDLLIRKQKVYKNQLLSSNIVYSERFMPVLGFLKIYHKQIESMVEPTVDYFLLYSRKEETNIKLN